MLNNKAQSLVIFVLCLPVFLLFIAYVFDMVNSNYEKKKLDGIIETLKMTDLDDQSMCELAYKNDEKVKCSIDNTALTLEKEIKSLFGKITGRNTYKIKATINKE